MSVRDTVPKKQTWDSMHEQSDADPPEQTSFWNDAHFLHIFPNESNYTFEWIDTFKKCNAQIFRLLNLILGAGLMWVPPGTQKYDFL